MTDLSALFATREALLWLAGGNKDSEIQTI